jgi:hypothetical protein
VSLSCFPALENPLADTDEVLMVVNSYLARGGQGFSALVGTPEAGEAGGDLDALLAWLRAQPAGHAASK